MTFIAENTRLGIGEIREIDKGKKRGGTVKKNTNGRGAFGELSPSHGVVPAEFFDRHFRHATSMHTSISVNSRFTESERTSLSLSLSLKWLFVTRLILLLPRDFETNTREGFLSFPGIDPGVEI